MPTSERNFLDTSSDITASCASWSAIFADASSTAAPSLILLVLGVGLVFSAISPWSNHDVSATTIGTPSILWLAFTQIVASGLGGYSCGVEPLRGFT